MLFRGGQNMSQTQKNNVHVENLKKLISWKIKNLYFDFSKNVTGTFLNSLTVFRKLPRASKKMLWVKKQYILNCLIFHNIMYYLEKKKTKFHTYQNGNSVPVLSVSKTIRTHTLLRTKIWTLISSVPEAVPNFQKPTLTSWVYVRVH